ncbi:DNA replication/repair protein RecF [Pelagibacterium luteolum]|uniref:DNA replication and repair protein RecF n=1 Tax=Pelagibacterium luteolum TaxID=440168 RepID=A0A1G7SM46_9HYPH|nr:DNA replication/repair protein RecF [Pelagibacterium luteolum]SDG24083.1 DNA replication and repair protein RecF [Pelagibacterium luteolum]
MTPPQRYISRLRLSAYRNYATAALDLDRRHVVLVGENGAGKTNLIEAISLLAPGRGLRRAGFDTLGTAGGDGMWAVAATVETEFGPVDIGTGASADASARRVRINGANAKSVEQMSEHLRVLWLTPAMDGLFTGPASERRRFLDRLVTTLHPGHSSAVNDFENAMRQRNRLLADNGDPAWITAVEAQMAELASALYFGRADSLSHLQALMETSVTDTGFPGARLDITPILEGEMPATASELEAALMARWRANRALDRAAGRTTLGPHRVDLFVTHAPKAMPAGLCSTGEQKALLIGLILVHARLVMQMTAIAPVLLLDEIAAHLDPIRRRALFDALDRLGSQCWMTGTDPMLFADLGARAQQFAVHAGQVHPMA